MKEELRRILAKTASNVGISADSIRIEYPESIEHGDVSTNVAMANAKKLGTNPRMLAERIISAFEAEKPDFIESVSIAGPGFINFTFRSEAVAAEIVRIGAADGSGKEYGWSAREKGKTVLTEFTDPNTFKVFHIGHLMSNAIGESLSRLIEASGAKVVRLCYPSDIGLHIAKSIWALQRHAGELPADDAPIDERTAFLGSMYVEGTRAYEADPAAKDDIDALNRILYEKSNPAVQALYEKGRAWSLSHFDQLYRLLGTSFDGFIFESEMAPVGLEAVKANVKPDGAGVFEESEGAIVFKGEGYGLHTRVFVNSHGLPTYEAKEIGLNLTKFKAHPSADASIIITASEQNDYFKVLLKVLTLIDADVGEKTEHIGHGMMRFASGKMSSRTGNVVTAESLIADIKDMVRARLAGRELAEEEKESIAEAVAVGAIKYTVLRSSPGSDIIFDSAASISFEGDSGPYLQYAAVRAGAVLDKAETAGIGNGNPGKEPTLPPTVGELERMIIRFPDIVDRACRERAPQHVAGYLTALAGLFNSFYASQVIIDERDPYSPYRIALTRAFRTVMRNGLWTLGIRAPERM